MRLGREVAGLARRQTTWPATVPSTDGIPAGAGETRARAAQELVHDALSPYSRGTTRPPLEVIMWSGTLTRYAIVGLAPVLVGCATMQNTPKQDYVWSCVEACKAEIPPQCQIVNVR
jgi:hypothetical protein